VLNYNITQHVEANGSFRHSRVSPLFNQKACHKTLDSDTKKVVEKFCTWKI